MLLELKEWIKTDKFDTSEVEWELGGIINNLVEDVKVNLNDPQVLLG